MKPVFERIWKLALPYQDKRDDKGHARIVLEYALMLTKMENADANVVVPAAILHDTGWSQLEKEERLRIFVGVVDRKTIARIRKKHERLGVKMAKRILDDVDYEKSLTDEILDIISQHDTRMGFISKNEGVVRDADKLWRFSKTGFDVDIKRLKGASERYYRKLKSDIDLDGFFYSESARKIARRELRKRKTEYGIT